MLSIYMHYIAEKIRFYCRYLSFSFSLIATLTFQLTFGDHHKKYRRGVKVSLLVQKGCGLCPVP